MKNVHCEKLLTWLHTFLVAAAHLYTVLLIIGSAHLSSLALVVYWLSKTVGESEVCYPGIPPVFEIGLCVLKVDVAPGKLGIKYIPDIET